jgi:hypothetical protein
VSLKVDLMPAGSMCGAAVSAGELESLGFDGVFSFQDAYDVFLALVAVAPVCPWDLLTNLAMPSPAARATPPTICRPSPEVGFASAWARRCEPTSCLT